jgi:hypothetical protein
MNNETRGTLLAIELVLTALRDKARADAAKEARDPRAHEWYDGQRVAYAEALTVLHKITEAFEGE